MKLKARLMLFFRIWPRTLEDAVTREVNRIDAKSKELVRTTPKKKLVPYFHRGWGMGIRNRYGLWHGNTALMESCGADHPDGASSRIIEGVWARLNHNWPQ